MNMTSDKEKISNISQNKMKSSNFLMKKPIKVDLTNKNLKTNLILKENK